ERLWTPRRVMPDADEFALAAEALSHAQKPVIVAGGGVLYSGAAEALRAFAEAHGVPVMETQAGKSSLPHDHPLNMGSVGVTGSSAANALAEEADLVLAIGTRLQDFTTGSWALFKNADLTLIGLNVQPYDALKHRALPLVADAKVGIEALDNALAKWSAPKAWTATAQKGKTDWLKDADAAMASTNALLPSDAQVIGAVARTRGENSVLVCAAGGLPGELHKLWPATRPGSHHLEQGFSTIGDEIA